MPSCVQDLQSYTLLLVHRPRTESGHDGMSKNNWARRRSLRVLPDTSNILFFCKFYGAVDFGHLGMMATQPKGAGYLLSLADGLTTTKTLLLKRNRRLEAQFA